MGFYNGWSLQFLSHSTQNATKDPLYTQHYSKIGIRWFRNVDCYKAGGRCQAAQIFCRESGPDTAEDNEIKQQSIRQ